MSPKKHYLSDPQKRKKRKQEDQFIESQRDTLHNGKKRKQKDRFVESQRGALNGNHNGYCFYFLLHYCYVL